MSVNHRMNECSFDGATELERVRSLYEKVIEKERRSISKGVIINDKKRDCLAIEAKQCSDESTELETRKRKLSELHRLRDKFIELEGDSNITASQVQCLLNKVEEASLEHVATQTTQKEEHRAKKRSKTSQEGSKAGIKESPSTLAQSGHHEDYSIYKAEVLRLQSKEITEQRLQLRHDKEAFEEKRLRIWAIQDKRENDLHRQSLELTEKGESLMRCQDWLEREKIDFIRHKVLGLDYVIGGLYDSYTDGMVDDAFDEVDIGCSWFDGK